MKRTPTLLFLCLCLLCLSSGCGQRQKSVSKSNFFFDTIITITLYGTEEESYIDECFQLAKKYENLLSNTVEGSDIWNINEHPGEYVAIDPQTRALIETGMKYGELSNGKFDITLGKLSELWNFSEIAENLQTDDNAADASVLPSDSDIQTLLPHINYQNILIDGDCVCLNDPDCKIDLGGIAKGYIADRMKEYLLSENITSGFINLGGNVLTLKEKLDGSSYTIGIQKPFGEEGELLATVEVCDKSVVSSGVYERYYKIDGKLYHHILDLSTGYPYENDLYEVTIICDRSVDGDALSTTCFALGLEEGMHLIETLENTEAIFVTSDGAIHKSSGIGTNIPFHEVQ